MCCWNHGLLVLWPFWVAGAVGCWPCVLLALNAAHISIRCLDLCALCAAGAVLWAAGDVG